MLAMGSLAMGMKPYVMFLTLISSGFLASLASEVAKIIYYRKGPSMKSNLISNHISKLTLPF
jgi:hypothetical protein